MVPPPRAPGAGHHLAASRSWPNLDIAERRAAAGRPHRAEASAASEVDLRVSILPTMFGESVVLRVLDRGGVELDLDQLGMRDDDADASVRRAHPQAQRHHPRHRADRLRQDDHALRRAAASSTPSSDKIITTEDPVEYDLDGIIQIQIKPEIGLTFAARLRSHPAPGPRHHPGRRDPRPGDRRDRHPGVADRPPGASHAAHQRRGRAPSPG